jgi:Pentapeptide repeats (8 copies).
MKHKNIVIALVASALLCNNMHAAHAETRDRQKDLQQLEATGICQRCLLSSTNLSPVLLKLTQRQKHIDISEADTRFSNFSGITITNTNMQGTNCAFANFENTTIKNTDARGANFTDAEIATIIWQESANRTGAIFNTHTTTASKEPHEKSESR